MSTAIIADFSTELERSQRERPRGVDAARWLRSRQNAAKFLADCRHLAARRGWQVDNLFVLPSNDRPGGLISRIYGGEVVSLTAGNATIARSPASISVIRHPSQTRSEAEAPAREVATVFGNFWRG